MSITVFVLGLIFGSFGNVLIARLPVEESIGGRSRCPHCRHILSLSDLIPVLSFLLLRGQCRTCHNRIAFTYPLVELASGFLFLFAFTNMPSPHAAVLLAGALWLLFLIAVIDARTQRIPDALDIPFIALSVAFAFARGTFDWQSVALPVGFFGVQWLISRGTWVGSGDVLLALGLGALLSDVRRSIVMLFLSYIIGAVSALILLARGSVHRKSMIPFGPFLAIGGFIAFLIDEEFFHFLF